MYISLCTTSLSVEAVHNQSSNTEREDNDTSHNTNAEQNCGNCKDQVVRILKYLVRMSVTLTCSISI